ncbi:MAG: glycoside hydrolase family 127 protein [Lewinella sp.]|nr:glycoside hydrolase family 127 protein [Lewinella sp.]
MYIYTSTIKWLLLVITSSSAFLACHSSEETALSEEGATPLQPVAFNNVILNDHFWAPRLETQIHTLVPFALEKTQPAIDNLEKAGKFLRGDTTDLPFTHRYISSDLYKVMEGAAYLLMINDDPQLEQRMDEIIDIIAAAQQDDGYLYVSHITGVADPKNMGERPYDFVVHSHELYNMGHMYEAAIAYYQATGKDKWLKVAEKNAQHINRVFFEGDPNYNDGKPVNQAPGHQELEIALSKLYRVTGNELYLDMAERFLDIRGVTYRPDGDQYMSPTYAQQHLSVTEQSEAVGHAVRAAYMYSGMADVGALKQTDKYTAALNRIWSDIVNKKMHITGGLGAMHGIEGFGPAYVLPNKEAYNETCAAVGNVLFNFRMFLLTRDAKYIDVAEIALYNNVLAGVNLEGNRFFYVNPLEADGHIEFNHGRVGRSPWFNTACCPSNLARLIPQVSGMIYSYAPDDVYVTLYAGSETIIPLSSGEVIIRQITEYPYDEMVRFEIESQEPTTFRLHLRIPTWLEDQIVPGALYHYRDPEPADWSAKLNGETIEPQLQKGFITIGKTWQTGDQLELHLPMPVRFNEAIDSVEADRGKLAISRGPLVYAAEGIDNEAALDDYYLPMLPQAKEMPIVLMQGVLSGIPSIHLPARHGNQKTQLIMLPYYAWNNREDGSMKVWIDENPDGQVADQ